METFGRKIFPSNSEIWALIHRESRMNSGQKNSILFGLFVIFFMVLLPPWERAGYGLIFDPPTGADEIDFSRLAIQVVLAAIVSSALFLLSKPTVIDDGEKIPENPGEARKTTIVLVCAVFCLAIAGVFAMHLFKKQEAVEVAHAQEKAALERINHQRAIVAVVANKVAQEKKAADDKELQHLKKLATPKIWRVRGNSLSSVVLTLHTYWKADQMYYKIRLKGSPEALEYAADAHPVFQIELANSDHIAVAALHTSMTELQPLRSKNGAITFLISANNSAPLSMTDYESFIEARLSN